MGRELSVPEKHQLRIAKQTINMPDAMVGVMGGPDKKKSAEIIRRLTGKEPKDYYERGQDSHVADSRRARLHRALDCVLDRSAAVRGRDELDDKQFLDLMERVGVLRDSTRSLQWPGNDNPRVQKASTDTYNATMSKVKQLIASSGVSPQEFRKRATKVASKVGRRINLNWIDSLDRH
jgi:hypothetical protein